MADADKNLQTVTLEKIAEDASKEGSLEGFKVILNIHAESYKRFELSTERRDIDKYVYNLIKRFAGSAEQEQKLKDYYERVRKEP